MEKQIYWEMIKKIKKLEFNFSSILADELIRNNINNASQEGAFVLYNIGHTSITVGELIEKEFYFGTNVNYTIKQLEKYKYVNRIYSKYDKRKVFIKLTPLGEELYQKIDDFIEKQANFFYSISLQRDEAGFLRSLLSKVENFCRIYLLKHKESEKA